MIHNRPNCMHPTADAAEATLTSEPIGPVFIGRQPILDASRQLVAYELLFRDSDANRSSVGSSDRAQDAATQGVIDRALNIVGFEKLTAGKRAYVNMTRNALLQQAYMLLPAQHTTVELLETIEPDGQVIAACRDLKRAGYELALDDFTFEPGYDALIEMADVIKVDLTLVQPEHASAMGLEMARRGITMLAEKVETAEQFNECAQAGYELFQGYFFHKPQVISSRDVPPHVSTYLQFLQQINSANVDFDQLENTVKQDLALSTRLLRYLNSAHFGLGNKIESIKQALVMLGEAPLRKWASVVAVTCMAKGKPAELVVTSLVRARFCERLSDKLPQLAGRQMDLFLLGLLSLIDAVTEQPIDEVLMEMPVSRDVRTALMGGTNDLGQVYNLIQCCERNDPAGAARMAEQLRIDPQEAFKAYAQAIAWADDIFAG